MKAAPDMARMMPGMKNDNGPYKVAGTTIFEPAVDEKLG